MRLSKGKADDMSREWLERDDLSVFVVAGAPRGFNKKIQALLEAETGEEPLSMEVKKDLGEWVLAQVRGEYRRESWRSPASKALWRAYRALAAARYHLRGDDHRHEDLRDLRDRVEAHWMEVSPAPKAAEPV